MFLHARLLILLADVGDGVHPASYADLVAYVGGVAELVDQGDVVGVGPPEQLSLQGQGVDLGHRTHKSLTTDSTHMLIV